MKMTNSWFVWFKISLHPSECFSWNKCAGRAIPSVCQALGWLFSQIFSSSSQQPCRLALMFLGLEMRKLPSEEPDHWPKTELWESTPKPIWWSHELNVTKIICHLVSVVCQNNFDCLYYLQKSFLVWFRGSRSLASSPIASWEKGRGDFMTGIYIQWMASLSFGKVIENENKRG